MTPEEFVEAVSEAKEVELSRLGSSRALYGDTEGDMSNQRVLGQAAAAERAAAETFERWAQHEAGDIAEALEATAREERTHYESIAEHSDGEIDHGVPAIHGYLRGVDWSVERLGAFVGRTIIADRSKDQIAGFFVGQGDTDTAEVFSAAREDLDDQLNRGTALLEATCGDDAECWDSAYEAAVEAIDVAYDEYTDNLSALGIDPKPIC